MATKLHDLLGKNLVSGLLELQGETLVEVEIPPTDSLRFDVWYVPDAAKRLAAPTFGGVLEEMARAAAVIEIWSDRIDEREFHGSYDKRHAWWRVLETDAKVVCPRPSLWHVTAGRPNLVLQRFGFQPVEGSSGHYTTTNPGWQVDIVVIRELPKTRETLLLRLLGGKRVREDALRELKALPKNAVERKLAGTWLKRLHLHVADLASLPSGPMKEFIVNFLEEYEQDQKNLRAEVKRKLKPQLRREVQQEFVCGLFERRLGRTMTDVERKKLAKRIKSLGADRVTDVALDNGPAELEVWLKG